MTTKVLSPGTAVNVGTPEDPLAATVVAVCLRGQDAAQVQYECVWWDEKTRTSVWLDAVEVQVAGKKAAKKLAIGFAGEDTT